MPIAFVALGSNTGNRELNLASAIDLLNRLPDTRVLRTSRWIQTEPEGGPPQPMFLNGVAKLDTSLEPRALLAQLQLIERELGRPADHPRWGPRPIDLDIVAYADRVLREPDLSIPHPLMHERRFVLAPLAELEPEWRHPVLGKSAKELLDARR